MSESVSESVVLMSCTSAVHIQILGLVGAALSSASLEKGVMVRVLAIPRGRRRGHPGGHPLLVLRIDLDAEESRVGSRHVSLHSLLQLNVMPAFRKELFRMFLQVGACGGAGVVALCALLTPARTRPHRCRASTVLRRNTSLP